MGVERARVHRFSTRRGEYLFDNVTGTVIPRSEPLHRTIDRYPVLPRERVVAEVATIDGVSTADAEALYAYVHKLASAGFFYPREAPRSLDLGRAILETPMSVLTLIVTEQCNLRCEYCVYSDAYPHLKGYTSKSMGLDTAKRAIDLYVALHAQRQAHGLAKGPIVTFYGGEPLLEPSLVRGAIEHCRESGYDATFYITTNGTLLSDEMIDLVVENGIVLTISLDGTRDEHDRKRVTASGHGTFDTIMANVRRLQDRKRDLGIEQIVTFNCCYDTQTDMRKAVAFFEQHAEILEPFTVFWVPISHCGTTYYDELEAFGNRTDALRTSMAELAGAYGRAVIAGEAPSKVLDSLFLGFAMHRNRQRGPAGPTHNACVPTSKLAVDPDGVIYVCERINQQLPIGDVRSGIDLRAVERLLADYLAIWDERCAECDVSRLCEVCYAHFAQDGKMSFSEDFCADRKASIDGLLANVYSILEENPTALDRIAHWDDVTLYETIAG